MYPANVIGTILLTVTINIQHTLATNTAGVTVCHDCSGLDHCNALLQNRWTGKCQARRTGKCFIRQDPNGILYRGCADSVNWPTSLDISYTGCRYQTYGQWSNTRVLWCFCEHNLCNKNITYIRQRYQGVGKDTAKELPNSGSSSSQLGSWYVISDSSLQRTTQAPTASSLYKPHRHHYPTIGAGNEEYIDWRIIKHYLSKLKHPVYPTYKPVVTKRPPSTPTSRAPQPRTTTPPVRVHPTTSRPYVGIHKNSTLQLIAFLNAFLQRLNLTTIIPPGGGQSGGGQIVFQLPPDVIKYLLTHLPHNIHNVQSLPYPLYVIIYLLSVTGYNINAIIPGFNITDILPGPGPLPTPSPPTSLDAICPSDYIKQPSLESCYKIYTQRSDARPVAVANDQCRRNSRYSSLISIETTAELNFLRSLLRREPVMLEGWQGWWTSGTFRTGVNQFYWSNGRNIPNTDEFWGFQRPPFSDTCVWVLQIPNYNYTMGNYDCFTSSGFICEISLQSAASS